MLLAIDPGLDTGWAEFTAEKKLYRCGLGDPRKFLAVPEQVIIERPQVYSARASKGDPNDLITLAIQVGRYTEHFDLPGTTVAHVLPFEWKRQLPKKVCHSRLRKILSPQEWEGPVAEALMKHPESVQHNILDAVGIGLWAVGRFRP